MLGTVDERDRIGRYKGPVLIAVGEDDYATRPQWQKGL